MSNFDCFSIGFGCGLACMWALSWSIGKLADLITEAFYR